MLESEDNVNSINQSMNTSSFVMSWTVSSENQWKDLLTNIILLENDVMGQLLDNIDVMKHT
jgi:hypothetical protein